MKESNSNDNEANCETQRAMTTTITLTVRRSILWALLWISCSFGLAIAQQEIVTLPTRAGVTQSYFLTSIPKNLHAVAVLFPGSGGVIQLRTENGKPRFNQGNFLVRSRAEFVKRGVVAAILDVPSDQQSGWGMSDEFRLGDAHFNDMSAVIEDLEKRFPGVPLFLVGTSRGTISAAALGARLGQRAAGAILTSTMFRQTPRNSMEPGQGLSRFDFSTITVPLLFVHHVSDQCASTPYGEAARLSERYPLITVFGGASPRSGPCDAFSQHGFLGKESETVEEIVNWMRKKPVREEVK
ncbi:MAG TPA: alpha/beta hydrolase [Candidatus Binatia bacterium]|nr:alpha/beta hydrolase [Candidatus Binatia bacterium]